MAYNRDAGASPAAPTKKWTPRMSVVEVIAAQRWVATHHRWHRWWVEPRPTSIGTAWVVRCLCGAQENVTDYSTW